MLQGWLGAWRSGSAPRIKPSRDPFPRTWTEVGKAL